MDRFLGEDKFEHWRYPPEKSLLHLGALGCLRMAIPSDGRLAASEVIVVLATPLIVSQAPALVWRGLALLTLKTALAFCHCVADTQRQARVVGKGHAIPSVTSW